ncbi:MAG: chemotaxis protein CheA [Gemmatimonadaceae bacterium]|nr:chemotaxis protein CheA [Gemmatimonadaceae bacterium]
MDQTRYAELFRAEAREHLAELDTTLLAFEQQADPEHVGTLFRSTHTIKGMAAAMGYGAVEQLSHALESLLDTMRSGDAPVDQTLVALLFEGTDALRASVDEAVAGRGDVIPAALTPLLQRLGAPREPRPLAALASVASPNDGLAGLTHGAQFDEIPPATERRETMTEDLAIAVRLTADCPLKGVRALLVLGRLEPLGVVLRIDPPQASWHGDTFDGAFTVSLRSATAADALEEAARAAGDVARVSVSAIHATPQRDGAGDALRTVRVDRRRLDTLLDLVGELVITRDRLLRIAEESDHSSTRALTRAAHETARLISALQDEVVQARMVPVGQVFDRFPRLVRDIARELGKDVHFVTEGREIELDRSLLDAIGDPIIHLLRNALDHGLEDAETRRAAGKAPTGTLTLRAARDRAAVILQVEDDGRGIDRDVILRRAHQQGLLPDSVATLDDDALLQVLAYAGFSTARSVTAVSGRGVGVDIVATRVRALGGALEIETLQGQGTVFTLRLPVTLAIARALLVDVAGSTYAIPADHVLEALAYDPGTLVTVAERESVTVREEVVPIVHLRERFGLERRRDDLYLAVVEVAGRRTALAVDALVAQQDIVVKSFDAVRGSEPWFSGATVLGDGTPALIVDLGSLT